MLLALQQLGGTGAARVEAPPVEVPRIEAAAARVDGVLDEPVWAQAALIDGFRQYEPADGRPAAQRTEVRVWYAPDAIWFGITAYDADPGSIRATRADRDNITGDDHVIIYLDTFLDRRRAFFFASNPLGVQQDGVRTEGAASAGRMFGGTVDTSPDFVYESAGRLTEEGYVIELRIPFSSLRFPASDTMQWGLNIERKTQRTGYVDTWPDIRRASASFLAQGGTLTGLHDLARGVVLEAQPVLTVSARGARADGSFSRGDPQPELSLNLRAGFTNYSLDATINPDFSQVEADAAQVTVNERFALFLTEKRPFFLEGIELFSTPNQLVYTRRIVEPVAGAKVTGKAGPINIALLTAVDEVASGDNALFNVARVRRDIGASSTAGLTLTDRSLPGAAPFNRVAAADTRIVFGGLYYAEAQLGSSWTRRPQDMSAGDTATSAPAVASAPIGKLELDRTGRSWGFNYQINAVGDDFETHAGFVNRTGVVTARAFNRLTWYGATGAALERVTVFFGPSRVWRYGRLRQGAPEGSEFVNAALRMRGEWEVGGRAGRDFVELDPQNYAHYRAVSAGGLRAYTPLDGVSGPSFELNARTPVFQRFNASASVGAGRVTIFDEGAAGDSRTATAAIAARPHQAVRVGFSTTYRRIERQRDGSEFARTLLPRLRLEYQPNRAFFVRAIGEYAAERRAALLHAVTGEPLEVHGRLASARVSDGLRLDLLASYQPTPGTIAFLGYGVSLTDRDSFAFDDLRRDVDALFLKLAYRFSR
jgi:hypothetical protein